MSRVVAYTYEADVHCPDCARKRFAPALTGRGPADLTQWHEDAHGLPIEAADREGNPVHPVFSTDERGDSLTHCGDCGEDLS